MKVTSVEITKNKEQAQATNNSISAAKAKLFELILAQQGAQSSEDLALISELQDFISTQETTETVLNQQEALLLKNEQERVGIESIKTKTENNEQLNSFHQVKKSSEKNSLNISDITSKDIDTFKQLAKTPDYTIQSINPLTQQITVATTDEKMQVNYKSLDVSKSLMDLMDYASKTQKPVRLDFDSDSSVILKVDKEGKVSAHFMSNDAATEMLLKSGIQGLRQRFEEEGLPYNELEYKQQNRQNKKQNNNNQDKGA